MLRTLTIQNYALIDKLDISFEKGFTTITGETGAGKSIILGAIGLLLGQRADIKSIKTGSSRCTVEATFETASYNLNNFFQENNLEYDGKECILRREITLNGKSRGFINDTPVTLNQMKELGDKLIDIHSQHQNLLLNKEDFQLEIVDIVSNKPSALEEYQHAYQEYKKCSKELEELRKANEMTESEKAYIIYQLDHIKNLDLKPNSQEELEEELEQMTHAEDTKDGLSRIYNSLYADDNNLLSILKSNQRIVDLICEHFPKAKEWGKRMESCYLELKDLSDEIDKEANEISFNPRRLQILNEELDELYSLEHRYKVNSVQEILDLADSFQKKLDDEDNNKIFIEELSAKEKDLFDKALQKAKMLTQTRQKTADIIEKEMIESLKLLGMPNIRFKVKITSVDKLTPMGKDAVTFLFTANKNANLENVADIASGGEIARVMLSLKALIASTVQMPTIIFDEIDTGVSGDIAERMARIMEKMGQNGRQIISITHLPQIAALGAVQYKVYKKDNEVETTSHICRLTDEERIDEIAHMLSGSTLTDAAIENAKELLKQTSKKNEHGRKK